MNIIIFGGTGTLGHAFVEKMYNKCHITIVSRCEIRQKDMKKKFPALNMILGDISNKDFINNLRNEYSHVLNFAAMKHVDCGETNVEHMVNVNYHGVLNTYRFSQKIGSRYIFISTDKAIEPINAYGMSKALAEKYLYNQYLLTEKVTCFRWGNILGSRGSVLQKFKDSLEKENKIYVTDLRATRFWTTIDKVANLVIENLNSHVFLNILESKSSSVIEVANGLAELLNIKKYEIKTTGLLPGEKLHEKLGLGEKDSFSTSFYSNLELKDMIKAALCMQ